MLESIIDHTIKDIHKPLLEDYILLLLDDNRIICFSPHSDYDGFLEIEFQIVYDFTGIDIPESWRQK